MPDGNNLKLSGAFVFAIVFILLVGMFLPLVCKAEDQVFTVDQNELLLNKEVFMRGETLNITVLANVDTVQISVYSPERLFLNYNQAANTSATFLD